MRRLILFAALLAAIPSHAQQESAGDIALRACHSLAETVVMTYDDFERCVNTQVERREQKARHAKMMQQVERLEQIDREIGAALQENNLKKAEELTPEGDSLAREISEQLEREGVLPKQERKRVAHEKTEQKRGKAREHQWTTCEFYPESCKKKKK